MLPSYNEGSLFDIKTLYGTEYIINAQTVGQLVFRYMSHPHCPELYKGLSFSTGQTKESSHTWHIEVWYKEKKVLEFFFTYFSLSSPIPHAFHYSKEWIDILFELLDEHVLKPEYERKCEKVRKAEQERLEKEQKDYLAFKPLED